MKTTPVTKLFLTGCIVGLLCFVLFPVAVFSIERDKVLYFNDIDGLPRNIVTCLEQDKYGYTWIGTANGISRYDGDVFKNYEELKGHTLRCLVIDNNNDLWIASEQGVYFYNRIRDQIELKYEGFIHSLCHYDGRIYYNSIGKVAILQESGSIDVLNNGNIRCFYVDAEGIWYNHDLNGVRFRPHGSKKDVGPVILDGNMFSVIREVDGHLFMGCSNGHLYALLNKEKVKKIDVQNHHNIHEVIKVDDEYWIATDGNGIIVLDEELNFKKSLDRVHTHNTKIHSNSIYDLFLGSNDELWIATYGAGLGCLIIDDSPFKNITARRSIRNSLIAKEGVSVFQKENKIYFGTNYGLSIFDEKKDRYTNFPMPLLKRNIQGGKVCAINIDYKENIWIGTYDGLLGKYSPDFKFIKSYMPSGNGSSDMQRIVFINKLGDEDLLVATNYRNRNLLLLDLKTEQFTPITLTQDGREKTYLNIVSIRKNKEGETIVLLRNDGFFTVNAEQKILENNLPEINKRITFRLLDFYQDNKGFYWMATQKDGLVRMSEDGREFDKWTMEQGLPTNSILRLESVDDKYLWISTISGLCRFDMNTYEVLAFNHGHGLPSNEFTARASTVTSDGRLIFGSYGGFTIVDPEKVETNETDAKVIISDITFQNQSIKNIDNKPFLKVPLEETKEIVLPFRRNSFTIHFFTKDKDLPKLNNYAYRLKGMEENWIQLGRNKQTTYTNLSPGTYTFEVNSTNNSNVWSKTPTQLQIKITPPWYLSWYAYGGYFVLFWSILISIHLVYTNRIRLKKEVEMSEYKVQQEHELTERKLAFFTNISHDLKTPLTLIDAPVKDLLESDEVTDSQINKLLIIKRNSQRLYKLITDILDFRKLTQKQLPLKVSESKVDEAIENIYQAFKAECDKKQIDFKINNSVHESIYVEIKKIEKIIWNLLSNAVKFTEQEGEIYLSVEKEILEDRPFLKLIVQDTGVGIPGEEKNNIFKRFYQKQQSAEQSSDGTGIGLSIVKELVELHHGSIEVNSTVGHGTTFIVHIPIDKTEYEEKEMASEKLRVNKTNEVPEPLPNEASPIRASKNNNYNLPVLLLVEDNVELREYMTSYFSRYYKICQAGDGREAMELVNKKKPDLIITDVRMPVMNGHEFCTAIRSNFDTSHLPIVMLTANGLVDQQIEGLSAGADAYITKPFDIKYLDTLVHSILENRKKIRNRIMGVGEKGNCENKLTEKDSEFVERLRLCIKNNLSNPHLNVDLISEHFAVSRTQLNRKIKSLTGQTPNNLIKSVRLKTAYELISEKGLRVAEAAYQTGFSDPNYFTICFKKEFGENPSQIQHA